MKTILRKSVLIAITLSTFIIATYAQRVITGTVYREGEPAAGVMVEGHKCADSYYTSFDGKYKLEADAKSKWIKFTYADDSRKLDIEGNNSNVIDFSFEGEIPVQEKEEEGVNTKSAQELMQEHNLEFMNDLSLYSEFYKQKDYKSALPHWNNLFKKFPKSTINIYIHGVNMYESFLEDASTWEEKEKNLNKMMEVYDRRIKFFDQKGFVLGRKGTDWFKYMLQNDELSTERLIEVNKKGYEWLESSIKEQKDETEVPVTVVFMQTTRLLFKLGQLSKETVVKNYDTCNNILTKALVKDPNDEKAALAQSAVEQIFVTTGAADCETLIGMYTSQFDEKSGDIDFIKSMLRKLNDAKCNNSDLFEKGAEKMYELDPSAEAAFNMARMFLRRGDKQKAKEYYQQAMNQESDQELLGKYYYEYAALLFDEKNLSEARNYAKKTLSIDQNNCNALMLIGTIYLEASKSYGTDSFDKSTVFWLVVDYFQKAARTGGECLADASQKAATYKAYFPSKEEGFFRGLTEGQDYKIEGWINETTKVRY